LGVPLGDSILVLLINLGFPLPPVFAWAVRAHAGRIKRPRRRPANEAFPRNTWDYVIVIIGAVFDPVCFSSALHSSAVFRAAGFSGAGSFQEITTTSANRSGRNHRRFAV